MKKIILLLGIMLFTIQMSAQDRPRFNPERFEADLEQYITTHAGLSPAEASAFFPVYKQMQKTLRMLFFQTRRCRHIDTRDNQQCLEAIKKRDSLDLQIKKVQQQYHMKFCKILPAGKVFSIIRAEEEFHRQAFRHMAKKENAEVRP